IIDQTNVVLNDDIVKALMVTENRAGLSISTGHNTLLNEADISTYGPNGILPMSPELAAHAHNAQSGVFDPFLAGQVPGHGPLNVLFVTGSYYDINIVSQINVLSDENTAMQLMWATGASASTSTAMISTGSNQAVNFAQIVDANTIGDQY